MFGTTRVSPSLFHLAMAILFMVTSVATQAEARNVPGSAAAATEQVYEKATDEIADGIFGALRAQNGVSVGTVSRGSSDPSVTILGGSVEGDNGSIIGGSINGQQLDIDGELEGQITTGSLVYGQRLDSGLVLYGAALFERLDVDTPYNSGTVEAAGQGLAFGLMQDQGDMILSAMIGGLALDYDVTRSNGAVTGSYGAERWFADVRGARDADLGGAQVDYDFGIRYVEQKDEAYTELGGGAVAAETYSSTILFVNTRTYLTEDPAFKPYIQGDLRMVFSDDSVVAGALAAIEEGAQGYLGIGLQGQSDGLSYDLGLGGRFSDDGFIGLAAQVSANFEF